MKVTLLVSALLFADRDWAQTAVDDLHFIRATLRENHPGPVDTENPQFAAWYKRGFQAALERAGRATTFAGYFFAINYYMSGFQDGHLGALAERHLEDHLAEERLQRKWPRFTVAYRNDHFVVDQVDGSDSNLPAAGDRLVACDGRAASAWAQSIIGDYIGLWSLAGQRSSLAPLLLVDEGNPFVRMPMQCTFEESGKIQLSWRPISSAELRSKLVPEAVPVQLGVRRIGKSGYWLRLPTFNMSDAATGAALKALTTTLRDEAAAIRRAEAIVFDVRGNRGGSSAAAKEILGVIWGDPFIAETEPRPAAVDWRVSAANLRFLRDANLQALRRQFGADSARAKDYEQFAKGFEKALANGDTFYRQSFDASPSNAKPESVEGRTILLTDNVCASACLDFADIVLRLPRVEHVGAETSADAIYIDNRAVSLPSGLGTLGFSMKVYRGRPRGHNQSYKPHRVWTGDMNDTAALEDWILLR